jgi:uncharacterized damage-inducible protein DinB
MDVTGTAHATQSSQPLAVALATHIFYILKSRRHRGQLYLLLGTLGVMTPPRCGLAFWQVRERSIQE